VIARRALFRGCACCATLALAACTPPPTPAIAAGERPDRASDEGGLWDAMDRAEARLKQSRFVLHDTACNALLNDMTRRLAPDLANDMRVYLVRNPQFNASMAPNGMMQVWSGLLLRVHNEDQLAAVIGHEIGHYRQRHSLQRLRTVRSTADAMAFFGIATMGVGVGIVGAVGNLAALAALLSYSRDQEREADALGLSAMHKAGYAPIEASRVWAQLGTERQAGAVPVERDLFTATHPAIEEREAALAEAARALPSDGGVRGPDRLVATLAPLRRMLLEDEVRQRQPGRSIAVFGIAERAGLADGPLYTAWAEVLRIRDNPGDAQAAREKFSQALASRNPPPDAWRGLGLVHRRANEPDAAAVAFRRYLQLAPDAPDAALVRGYLSGA
jgi:predicted Zn-dependent protease